MKKQELEQKRWYRAFKVILFSAGITWITVIGTYTVVTVYNEYPFQNFHYSIVCSSSFSDEYSYDRTYRSDNVKIENINCSDSRDTFERINGPRTTANLSGLYYAIAGIFTIAFGIGLLFIIRKIVLYIAYGKQK